jgi:hypothetical protein
MKLTGKVLAGSAEVINTKKGDRLAKAKVKVLDTGAELKGDIAFYWVDFLGPNALNQVELDSIQGEEVEVDVVRVRATQGTKAAFLNITGGAMHAGGKVVQSAIQQGGKR